MNLAVFSSGGDMFASCECIKGYAFNITASWVKCALLTVICDIFGLSQDNCAHLRRVECLLPHNCPA